MQFNRSVGLVILGITLGSLAVGVRRSSGQAPVRPTTWEYKIENTVSYAEEKEFNDLGKDGWELTIAIQRKNHADVTYIFKRKRPN